MTGEFPSQRASNAENEMFPIDDVIMAREMSTECWPFCHDLIALYRRSHWLCIEFPFTCLSFRVPHGRWHHGMGTAFAIQAPSGGKLFNKQSSWRWYKTPLGSWDFIVLFKSQAVALIHWGRDKMAAILNGFSWMKMCKFRLKFYWSLFLRV